MGYLVRARLVGLTMLLIIVSAPHTAEDFEYAEFARFGISAAAAGFALGAMYALQCLGAYLTGRGARGGRTLLATTGALWCLGALLIHGREIAASGDYRHGIISKALEIAIVITGAIVAIVGFASSGSTFGPSPPRRLS